jgi:hypothetical protein
MLGIGEQKMELNREQIIKALKNCAEGGADEEKDCPFYDPGEFGDIEKCTGELIKSTYKLVVDLNTELNDTLDLLYKSEEENERLKAELAERPPRLVITKLQKGSKDENSKDTAALQECKADHYI